MRPEEVTPSPENRFHQVNSSSASSLSLRPSDLSSATLVDRNLLTPEDAIYNASPPWRQSSAAVNGLQKNLHMTSALESDAVQRLRSQTRYKEGDRSRSRRRKGAWKKLLWVKQSCEWQDAHIKSASRCS